MLRQWMSRSKLLNLYTEANMITVYLCLYSITMTSLHSGVQVGSQLALITLLTDFLTCSSQEDAAHLDQNLSQ